MSAPCNKTNASSSHLVANHLVTSHLVASHLVFRYEVEPCDSKTVRELVAATGKFYVDEVEIAVELIKERLQRGPASGYEFVFVHRPFDSSPNQGGLISGANQLAAMGANHPDKLSSDLSDERGSSLCDDGSFGNVAEVVGFACYGKIPCTREAYDLYWIALHPNHQGCGLGRQLLSAVEQAIRAVGGTQLYADTSGRSDYEATRRYYLATGFHEAACLADFYAPGDDKIIFRKSI